MFYNVHQRTYSQWKWKMGAKRLKSLVLVKCIKLFIRFHNENLEGINRFFHLNGFPFLLNMKTQC